MAMDLMLKSLMNSPEFLDSQEKNWLAISKMLPGTTPRQCQRRYEELLQSGLPSVGSRVGVSSKTSVSSSVASRNTSSQRSLKEHSRPPKSEKNKDSRVEGDPAASKEDSPVSISVDQGYSRSKKSKSKNPVMVIHVCDEAKNLKEDFHCPRDLLMREMRYFAEYLSTDAQRCEEVDISVHCDVQIFDWLMKYVKRNTKDVQDPPSLDPTSVISILISSDFLKMDSLVQKCIEFCHKNMSGIIATPSNMNCINDRLTSRIADLLDQNEADDIRDRKDKFKSKLFAKKLEKLFDPKAKNSRSPENASTLFRCAVCKRLLTSYLEKKLGCLPNRMLIDRDGGLTWKHVRDPTWDVNDYLLEQKSQLKTWRHVYWRVWGTINFLTCARCGDVFSCTELGQCSFHPEKPDFDSHQGAAGQYPCCQQKVVRFDPSQTNRGCMHRDHIVNLPDTDKETKHQAVYDEGLIQKQHVYDDLLSHRDVICLPYQKSVVMTTEHLKVDVFAKEEQYCGLKQSKQKAGKSDSKATEDSQSQRQPRLQALTVRSKSKDDGESDDDDEDQNKTGRNTKSGKSEVVTIDPEAILLDAPDFSTPKTKRWDSSRSLRWNQDAQREEDQRRMNDIISYLTKLRLNAEKTDRYKQREYSGGVFAKLEAQWKAATIPPSTRPINPTSRNKPRLGQPMK